MSFTKTIQTAERIFFVGIGGISMSSLAHMALAQGKSVAGSDRAASATTKALEAAGAKIVIGHYQKSVRDTDLVVYTAAIGNDSPELSEAKRLGIPTLSRGEYLGHLMQSYRRRIGISGTHGKTTTTTLLSHIALFADTDPTVMNGALSKTLDHKAYRIGKDELFLYEACEYKASFHDFYPTTAVITGIELDHTDFYPDLDSMIAAFARSLETADIAIINQDDEGAKKAASAFRGKIITFSLKDTADYTARDIAFEGGVSYFTLIANGERYPVTLPLIGSFNIANALAALAAADQNGISLSVATKALASFEAPDRRFNLTYRGDFSLYDDYAHHPSEIKATLSSARKLIGGEGRLITVFQSHTYTRTHDLFDDFKEALSLADLVYMPDIFAAREVNTVGVSSEKLCQAIGDKATYIADFEALADEILRIARAGDIVITMGAGDVYKIGQRIKEKLTQ